LRSHLPFYTYYTEGGVKISDIVRPLGHKSVYKSLLQSDWKMA
jgi:hypothetical protein